MTQFQTVHFVFIILLSTGLFAHVQIIPLLLNVAGRDAWITPIFALIPLLLWVYVISKKVRVLNGKSVTEYVRSRTTKKVYFVMMGPFVGYFLFQASVTTADLVYWSQNTFVPFLPFSLIAFVLVLLCTYAASRQFSALAISSFFLLPLVAILGFFIAVSNTSKKDYTLLLPLMENGVLPVLEGTVISFLPLFELVLCLFFLSWLKKRVSFVALIITGAILVGLIAGPTAGAIAEFGPSYATLFRYPAYEQWRLLTIGKYVSNVDFLAIFQWFSGAIIRIGLFLYLTALIVSRKKSPNRKTTYICAIPILLAVFMPMKQHLFYQWAIGIVVPYLIVFMYAYSLIFLIWLNVLERKKGEVSIDS
ncbi:endospore germination permease [Alteribacter aurantiacus]|uniref:endospore germination permease n=1 Tax=Alteribacter aurantiacus TaxID=254410 RepID=UPI00042794B0|nr:endospore germination permease [Alteribacter aurantiacus]